MTGTHTFNWEGFSPISLKDLNSQASMLTRVDRKYILTISQAQSAINLLSEETRILDIDGLRSHAYSSIYFDTPELSSFYGSAHPRRRRFKVRLRRYDDSALSFLEVKTRGPRGLTVKERIPYDFEASHDEHLTSEGQEWVHTILTRSHICTEVTTLAPTLHGNYSRTTLLLPGGQGRATLDTNLKWHLPQGQCRQSDTISDELSADHLVIIETKSSATPSALDHALWSTGIRPTRISKYATALSALRPELPHHRWHRTLGRHFPSYEVAIPAPQLITTAA